MTDLDKLASEYVDQATILSRMPWLTAKRMSALRSSGLRFIRGKKDTFVYRLSDVHAALEDELCSEKTTDCGNTLGDGSAESMEQNGSMSSGMSPEEELLAAEHLEQQI